MIANRIRGRALTAFKLITGILLEALPKDSEAARLLLLLSCFLVLQAQAECRFLGVCEDLLDKPNRFGLLFF